MLAVSVVHGSGTVTAPVSLVAMGVALSIAASWAGAAFWAARTGTGDRLFADLMLWGWVRRWRTERQLASAVRLLGLREAAGNPEVQLSTGRRVRLLKQLAAGLEVRLPDTHGHSRRVARHAAAIAKRMGLAPEEVARIRTAAAVHDVGKIETPVEIIEKPGPLTEAEFALVKQHVELGARMVAGLGDSELVRIVRHHHERFDGTGYPDGCAGREIPLGARIVAVADTFDAITSTRSYRPAKRHRDALALLAAEAGAQLDAEAVRAFRHYYGGHRPAALWALLLNGPRQLIASLATEAKLGAAVSVATLASVAAGGVAVTASHPGGQASPSRAPGNVRTQLAAFSATGPDARRGGDEEAQPGSPGFKQGLGAPVQGEGGTTGAGSGGRGGANPIDTPSGSGGDAGSSPSGGANPRPSGGGSSGGDQGGSDRPSTSSGRTLGGATSNAVATVTQPVGSTVNTVVDTVDSVDVSGATSSIPAAETVVRELPVVGADGR